MTGEEGSRAARLLELRVTIHSLVGFKEPAYPCSEECQRILGRPMSLFPNSISQKSNHGELGIRGWLVFGSRASFRRE
jgi:hypothetical protein